MDDHIIQEESFRDSRGRKKIWLDCSCGWFHAVKNKTHGTELKELHKKYPNGIPNELFISV